MWLNFALAKLMNAVGYSWFYSLMKSIFKGLWAGSAMLFSFNLHGAIDIIFDYSYDTGNYFSDDRKYIMEQVGYVFESRMGGESFAGYRPSADLGLSSITGLALNFTSPSSSATVNPAVASTTSDGNVIGKANELIIFLGAKSIAGSTLASAGSTGRTGYSAGSGADLTAMQNALNAKNSTTNFEPIAGSSQVNTNKTFYFDTDLTTHTDALSSGKTDFYTVMVHEIGHVMGFSKTRNAWIANKSGNFWTGANAKAQYNGENVPLYPSSSHWDKTTTSGSGALDTSKINCDCHPSMLPSISINKRTSFSALDFALLKDIGYNISGAPVGTNIGGTFTDPTLGGTYYIPVKETYASWLAGGGGGGGSAAPEPAYVFTLMGGFMAFFFGKKNLANLRRKLPFFSK
jgi:hypothetical protein